MGDVLDELGGLVSAGDGAGVGALATARAGEIADALKALALGDVARARALSDALQGVAGPGARERCRLLAARGHVLSYANDFAGASEALRAAAEAARSCGDDAGLAGVLVASVQPLARLGNAGAARGACEEAARVFAALGDRIGEGKALLNLGIVLRMQARLEEALAAFARAGELVAGDALLSGALASNRAEVLLDLERFADAEAEFRSAGALFRASGRGHGAAIVEGNLADLLSREGRLDEALEAFERAEAGFALAGAEADRARLGAERAEALATLGLLGPAVEAFRAALPVLEGAGLAREAGRARLGLGVALLRAGMIAEAEPVLRQSAAALAGAGQPTLGAEAEAALAVCAVRQGRAEDALRWEAGALAGLAKSVVRAARARAELAHACLERGDLDRARAHLAALDALDAARAIAPLRASAAHARGALALAEGDAPRAVRELQDAAAIADALRGSLRAEGLRVGHGAAQRGLHLTLCRAGLRLGGPEGLRAAFAAIEGVRARSVLDALGATGSRAGAEDAELSRCLAELGVLYSRFGLGRSGAEDADGTPARIAELERRAESLRARAEQLDPGAPAARLAPAPLDEALAAIPADAALVQFFEDGDELSALVLRRGVPVVRRGLLSLRDALALARRVAFALEAALTDPGAEECCPPLLESAGARLLGPLEDDLRGVTALGVGAFGALDALPWAGLRSGGVFAAERWAVTRTPSVSVALRAARAEGAAPLPLLALGVADEYAPEAEREAKSVGEVGPRASRCLTGADATGAALLAEAPCAALVHLACHGVHSPHHPLSSRLRLHDRWLTVRELVPAVRRGSCYVLAACDSARAGGPAPEDRRGMARALVAAGAARVVGAAWPLRDADSAALMPRLHRRLAAGEPPAAALAGIQTEAIREGVPASTWAALHVYGGLDP